MRLNARVRLGSGVPAEVICFRARVGVELGLGRMTLFIRVR